MVLVAVGVGLLHGAGTLTVDSQIAPLTAAAGTGGVLWLASGLLFGWGAFVLALDNKKSRGDRYLLRAGGFPLAGGSNAVRIVSLRRGTGLCR